MTTKRDTSGQDQGHEEPRASTVVERPVLPSTRSDGGALVMIGGHEDKEGDRAILREVCCQMPRPKIVVLTVASTQPEEMWPPYRDAFTALGVKEVVHLDVSKREDAFSEEKLRMMEDAGGLFFTGGDQLRITSKLGGAPICEHIDDLFAKGAVIAGTSAGASVMSENMLVSGPSDQSASVRGSTRMAPGLGLIGGVIIDQHFAERGRLGRLVGAISQNPRLLGVGIDENTAIVARDNCFKVIGAGAVYVVDAMGESYTNVSESDPETMMSAFDIRLHILASGDEFDFENRRPLRANGKDDNKP